MDRIAYVEEPDDVFNPTVNPMDWLELIDSGASPSSTSMSMNGQTATLVGYIPWNKQRSAERYFLGYAYVDSGYTLHRENPQAHPTRWWLFCTQCDCTAFVPYADPDATDPDEPMVFVSPFAGNDQISLDIANHQLAVCKLTFHSYQMSFAEDNTIFDPREEWTRNTVIDCEPKVEALSANGTSQLTFVETGSGGGPPINLTTPALSTKFPAPVVEKLTKSGVVVTWFNVPFDYLSSSDDYFWPDNIIAALGTVNSQNFPFGDPDPFLPETLYFDSVKFEKKVFPVAPADPTWPLISVDITMVFNYFNPPLGAASPIMHGHNNEPWRGTTGDLLGGKFFRCTRGGKLTDPPLLLSSDHNLVFTSPNA